MTTTNAFNPATKEEIGFFVTCNDIFQRLLHEAILFLIIVYTDTTTSLRGEAGVIRLRPD
ncbi:MAG: hypothetical protein ACUBOA_00085 [Candidatus Loosdrechtia sp.]|uniref:hypothetical protein n=1 Tax=Candidatus Loosdrechtia sp. TaxID=3101272 RepID=UPI003A799BE9|nr:MAG: hypothetical protein QY305_03725 [Candidatus Jettenia sp. AMX2]